MSKENVEKVRRSLDGWNRGDLDAWLEASHPEVEFVSEVARRIQGSETVYRGTADLRRFWNEWHAVWQLSIEISEIHDLGDTVVAVGRVLTRGGASGVPLQQPVAYVFEFDEGKVRKVRAYLEPERAFEDAGLRTGQSSGPRDLRRPRA